MEECSNKARNKRGSTKSDRAMEWGVGQCAIVCGGHPVMCRKNGFRDYLRVSCSPRKFHDTGSRRGQLRVEKRGHGGGKGAKALGKSRRACNCMQGRCVSAGRTPELAGSVHHHQVQYF